MDEREKLFTRVYNENHKILVGWVMKLVRDEHFAKDVVQEVFISLWKRDLDEIQDFRAYLVKSVRLNLYTHFRGEYARKKKYSMFKETIIPHCEPVRMEMEQDEIIAAVHDILHNSCTPWEIKLVTERWINEKKNAVIAKEMGTVITSIKSGLWRAMSKLKTNSEQLDTIWYNK